MTGQNSKNRFSAALFPSYVDALLDVKKAAALANEKIGAISAEKTKAIVEAIDRVRNEKEALDFNFFGSLRTPINGRLTGLILKVCADNGVTADDLDLNQATNDVTATAVALSVRKALSSIEPAATVIAEALDEKAREFKDIVKCGRSGLRDSVPVSLGQNFHAFSFAVKKARKAISDNAAEWDKSFLGAGDMGTGAGIDPRFKAAALETLREVTGFEKIYAYTDPTELDQSMSLLNAHHTLELLAFAIWKTAHDFEFMASGPRGGIREIALPAVAPGSSIMPGKINPTVAEMAMATTNRVLSDHDAMLQSVHRSWVGTGVEPGLAVKCILEGAELLRRTCHVLTNKVIKGIQPNLEKCELHANSTLELAQALRPFADGATLLRIKEKATCDGITVKEAAVSLGVLSREEADTIFDLRRLASSN